MSDGVRRSQRSPSQTVRYKPPAATPSKKITVSRDNGTAKVSGNKASVPANASGNKASVPANASGNKASGIGKAMVKMPREALEKMKRERKREEDPIYNMGFILFRHKYCGGEALDFGVPTNDGGFGSDAIKKAVKYGRKQKISGLISELEMILTK